MTEVEPVCSEASECDGESQGGVPAVSLGPATFPPLAEDLFAQTDGVWLDSAVGNVPVVVTGRRAAAATAQSSVGALVERVGGEETVRTEEGPVEPLSSLTRAENTLSQGAAGGGELSVVAVVVTATAQAGQWQVSTGLAGVLTLLRIRAVITGTRGLADTARVFTAGVRLHRPQSLLLSGVDEELTGL